MAIPIEKQFVVNAGRREVWAFLTDPSRVAGCLPGAAITEQVDERTHAGTIAVKVGPVSARYKGTVRFERLDEGEGVAEIVAAGQDVRGKGGADMRMTSRVVEHGPAETEVTVSSTVNISGILAQFGRGLIQDVSDQMFRQFTEAMRAALESAGDEAGADGAAGDRPVPDAAAGDGPDAAPRPADSAGAPRPPAESTGARAPAGAGGDAPDDDAIDAVSLGAQVGGRALGRLVRRPGFWLAVVVVAAILLLIVD
ncbi:MAG: membrane oxidoreductase [Chloroflexi bacterium]|nr:membrane oxidoreductase [Chloroflexota bacterium]